MTPAMERLLLGTAVLSTLALSVRLWNQPSRTEELAQRVESLEHTVEQLRGAPALAAQEVSEQRIAASVVQALSPRLDQLAQGRPLAEAPAARAAAKPELSAEQTAAAREAGGLVDAAIARGRLDEADATRIREKLGVLSGAPEGQALLARIFAAMNQGKLQVDLRNGRPSFLP